MSSLIQALVHQPFAMGDGCPLRLLEFRHEGVPNRKRHTPGSLSLMITDSATAGPGRRCTGMFHYFCGNDVIAVFALHHGHGDTSLLMANAAKEATLAAG